MIESIPYDVITPWGLVVFMVVFDRYQLKKSIDKLAQGIQQLIKDKRG